MGNRFQFDPQVIQSVVGGQSALDMPSLNIKNTAEADSFLNGYGFETENNKHIEKLWYYHRRSLVLMTEKLGFSKDEIPQKISDPKQLEDIRNLLIYASQAEDLDLQKWSCALLRCIHVFVHSENDLFSSYSEEIQRQILAPIQACIFHDGTSGSTYLKKMDGSTNTLDAIELAGFESKPFKTSSSTVIKLLAKRNALAMSVFDKLGVRFVTKSVFDSFQVVRFLVEENLISYPHIMPDQSSNNLYPADLFLAAVKVMKEQKVRDSEDIRQFLEDYFAKNQHRAEVLRKENLYSGADYQFIKFISRKLIRIDTGSGKIPFSFFYPFEVQIIDIESQEKTKAGPSEHQAYKERQRVAARLRLFPESQ